MKVTNTFRRSPMSFALLAAIIISLLPTVAIPAQAQNSQMQERVAEVK